MTGTAIHVAGVGFWSAGFPDPAAWLAGRPDAGANEPRCRLVSPRHLRFTSILTRMAAAVFEQATAGQDIDLSAVDVIFASSLGEIQIAVELLDKIAAEGSASPARFMNSVHNTAPGHLSIATGGRGMFTALAAGPQTVSAAFQEALCLLASPERESAVVIVADESLPAPIDVARYPAMAIAFLLARGSARPLATIAGIRSDPSVEPPALEGELAANPCAPGLGVLDAVLRAVAGPVRLDRADDEGWVLDLAVGVA